MKNNMYTKMFVNNDTICFTVLSRPIDSNKCKQDH